MLSFLDPRAPTCPTSLLERARSASGCARVAIANAGAPLPIASGKAAAEAGLISPVLIGNREEILSQARKLEWDISRFEMIEADGEEASARAAMDAVNAGRADILMKGQLHTDVFMKAALDRDTGVRAGKRFVHIFYMTTPESERPLILTDCAVNVAPDLKTRQVAVESVLRVCEAVGIARPKIAALSATEEVLSSVPSSGEANELVQWARQHYPDAHFSGPLAMDLILSQDAARIKNRHDDPVAGDPDAIIMPDLVSGNSFFKALVYLRAACAAGVVMGGKVPIVLTSRADPPQARLASLALATLLRSRD